MSTVADRPVPPVAEPEGAFVLGPPRSGTSAMTRLAILAGLSPAREDDLVPGGRNNPTGHFESRSVVAIDRQLMAAGGTRWWCPSAGPLRLRSGAWPAEAVARARSAFLAVHPARNWVCKDPRLAFTLPLWRGAVSAHPAAVLVFRSPAATSASMMRTWTITAEHALALWERYVRSALAALAGLPVFVAPFEAVVAAGPWWAGSLAGFLRSVGLAAASPGPEAVGAFLTTPRGARGHPEVVPAAHQLTVARALEDLSGGHERFRPPALPPEPAASQSLFEVLQADLAAGRGLDIRPRWSQPAPVASSASSGRPRDEGR